MGSELVDGGGVASAPGTGAATVALGMGAGGAGMITGGGSIGAVGRGEACGGANVSWPHATRAATRPATASAKTPEVLRIRFNRVSRLYVGYSMRADARFSRTVKNEYRGCCLALHWG